MEGEGGLIDWTRGGGGLLIGRGRIVRMASGRGENGLKFPKHCRKSPPEPYIQTPRALHNNPARALHTDTKSTA